MKTAWRLRRIALEQGMKSRQFIPLRFASTAATSPAPAPAVEAQPQTLWSRTPTPAELQNQAGPSNYATRTPPPSTGSTSSDDPSSSFFTSHRPLDTPLQQYLSSFSDSDSRSLRALHHYLYLSRARRDAVLATTIWRQYARLSVAARASLHPNTMQRVLRGVVPSPENFDIGSVVSHSGSKNDNQNAAIRRRAARYGVRLQQVLQDMENLTPAEDGVKAGPRPSDYRFAFHVLGDVGDMPTAEAFADGMRLKGLPMDIRMIDSRLHALVEWLEPKEPASISGALASRISRIIWQILGDMTTFDLTPRNVSTTLLIQAIDSAKRRIKTPEVLANLDVVLEDVCKKAYGVDMKYLTLGEKGERLKGVHVHALVDYWGRKGKVWKMLSTYEVLAEDGWEEAAEQNRAEAGEDEGEVPTLSGMMSKEAEVTKGMGWFGRLRGKPEKVLETMTPFVAAVGADPTVARGGHDLPPHLEQLPFVPAPGPPTFSDFFPLSLHTSPDPSSSTYPPHLAYPTTRLQAETISVLIRHTVTAGDMPLLNHILASALASVKAVRAEWLQALQIRHARTDGDPTHADWFHIPGPRVSVATGWFWQVELFVRKADVPLPLRRRFQALLLEAKAQTQAEREILEGLVLPKDPEAEASAKEARRAAMAELRNLRHPVDSLIKPVSKPFDPRRDLEALVASDAKLDVILERSVAGVEHKERVVEAKKRRSELRYERKMAEEREKEEAVSEKRMSRVVAAAPALSGESSGESGAVRMSGWGGERDNGVRMIGMA